MNPKNTKMDQMPEEMEAPEMQHQEEKDEMVPESDMVMVKIPRDQYQSLLQMLAMLSTATQEANEMMPEIQEGTEKGVPMASKSMNRPAQMAQDAKAEMAAQGLM